MASWSARVGHAAAGAHAPLAVWPAAGASDGRGLFLRGHSLWDDGIVVTPAIGRAITFGNLEYSRPAYANVHGTLAVAGFVDTARTTRQLDGASDERMHVDVGGGLRLGVPTLGGPVRIDFAYGLRDGARKLSAGYLLPWGR